jgi:hypothetical protein
MALSRIWLEMERGIRYLMRRLLLCCVVLICSAALLEFAVVAGEGGWRWRMNKIDDGRLLLTFTETEGTDSLGTQWFYCKPASGWIDVFVVAHEKERKILADFIRSDSYPKVRIEDGFSLVEPSFSEASGWEYHFEVAADGATINKLRKTGRFGFQLGAFVADWGKDAIVKSGLDKIGEFQMACRKRLDGGSVDQSRVQR